MIQPNELRIGNWVKDERGRLVTIHGIESNWNYVWLNHLNGHGIYCLEKERIEPIPLTPEVLEKCGFFEYISYYLKSGVRITKFLQHGGVDFAYTGDSIYTEVKHLHQLQNLYFALTGEELEYKQ